MNDMWCILRTSGPRTVLLATSLRAVGIEAWTPLRTIRRPIPGQRRRLALGRRREMREVAVSILPSFVFVPADQLEEVARIGALPSSPHTPFTIFQFGGRVPMVSDLSVAGLRAAEAEAEAATQAEREAESREEARQKRAEQLRTDRARTKALRSERKVFAPGQQVIVHDMPALAGMVGRVIKGQGTSATINFGGRLTMKVEAWRVRPSVLCEV